MPPPLIEPITDAVALEYLRNQKTVPTLLDSKTIAAEWSEDAKVQSFFSARVAKADLLDGIRRRVTQVVQGEMTRGQAKEWVREFLVTDGANSMRELGFLATDQELNEANRITELGSARRISLIVDQNVRMAESVGEWQRINEVQEFFPYVQYLTRGDDRVRPSHRALHGKIYMANSPALAAVFPPNDFRCRCFVEQLAGDELEGRDVEFHAPPARELSESGYSFNPALGVSGNGMLPKDNWMPALSESYQEDMRKMEAILDRSPVRTVASKALGWISAFFI